ncbi:twin-arginine translocation signal domain-containing protein [Eggerthellaceae bacterium zg-997]|nr:twin-arginine translocation signal domain-containing protein [Berryella wangjianweii]NPD32195.1 twin-arginine translocation signal domain-containing protein [Eggerthellaceae bacterium zg-997]
MGITRRGFLKATGLAAAGSLTYGLSTQSEAFAFNTERDEWKLVNTEEYTNICCYCSGGCGVICSVRDGELVNLEGDPDHVVNEGTLCPKGATMFQLRNVVDPKTGKMMHNPNRVTSPKVRRPFTSEWVDISWDDAAKEIAAHIKKTRDESFITEENGVTVNYTPAIGSMGGSQLNSEETYLVLKLMRSLGIVALDNQARV